MTWNLSGEQLNNESGWGADLVSAFGMDDETFALAPSDSQWSDPDLSHWDPISLVRLQSSVGVEISRLNPQVIIYKLSFRYVELLNF
jgi:hypothetical protein